jgi:hypothetical protein
VEALIFVQTCLRGQLIRRRFHLADTLHRGVQPETPRSSTRFSHQAAFCLH